MEKLYQGKTKDVYRLDDHSVRLKFKDTMTGKDGVFDPGENTVGLEVEGSGKAGIFLTQHFFELFTQENIPHHFIQADLNEATMDVRKVIPFGHGLEFICRFKAVGSFYKRYGAYIEEKTDIPAFFEVTIKDDERQDPFISEDALILLGILTSEEYQILKTLTVQAAEIVKQELKSKGLDLYDIKFEFGRDTLTQEIILIDEISGGNMRVFDKNSPVDPLELVNYFI